MTKFYRTFVNVLDKDYNEVAPIYIRAESLTELGEDLAKIHFEYAPTGHILKFSYIEECEVTNQNLQELMWTSSEWRKNCEVTEPVIY